MRCQANVLLFIERMLSLSGDKKGFMWVTEQTWGESEPMSEFITKIAPGGVGVAELASLSGGRTRATDINTAGQVAGWSDAEPGVFRAFIAARIAGV